MHRRIEEEIDQSDRFWQLPRVIPARDGKDYIIDEDGEYWRAITLIASAHAHPKVQGVEHAYEAGYVLGQFQRLISDPTPTGCMIRWWISHTGYLTMLDAALQTQEAKPGCTHRSRRNAATSSWTRTAIGARF